MIKKDQPFDAASMKEKSLERFIVLVEDLISEAANTGTTTVSRQVYRSSILEPAMNHFMELGFNVGVTELKNGALGSFTKEFKGDNIVNFTISWD